MAVKAIPEGFHTITPYLTVKGVDKLIDFLKHAFDAKELHVSKRPDGTIMHAEMRIGDSPIMMGEAHGEWKPSNCMLYLYVNDVDAVYKRAIQAGGTSQQEPKDQFYGDRSGGVKDHWGNSWWIATHVEDVSPEEMKRREVEYMQKQQQK